MQLVSELTTSIENSSSVFNQLAQLEHEQVVFCNDKDTGLKAIIAIHNTTIGPALGGTRMWNYRTEAEALEDVLRLSRGMTYKSAISGINLGGGKAVVMGDSRKDKSEALWRRYGKFINSLNGKYITAEDVGTTTEDIVYIAEETEFVTGKPEYMGGGGNPSPFTAYGTYLGMKASARKVYGTDSLNGKSVLVQGVGSVGSGLVEYLAKEHARILVSDIYEDKLQDLAKQYKVEVVHPDDVYDADMDIYAPCALGATLTPETISRLKCSVVAGSANNQLKEERRDGNLLRDKGILYAPDFLINAGGVINVYMEWIGYNYDRSMATIEQIYNRTLEIFNKAQDENLTTHAAAMLIAEERITALGNLKTKI